MMNVNMCHILLFSSVLLLCHTTQLAEGQTAGSEYYVSFFENGSPNLLYVYVTTLEREYVDFTITAPGTSYISNRRVRYGEVIETPLSYFTYRLADSIERGKTIVVQSENTLLVYGINQGTQGSSTDSFLALPKMEVDALNEYKYIAASYITDPSLISPFINQEGEIAVVSQYNDTVVSITPSVEVSVNGVTTAAGSTTNITLQYAEILLITDTDDMTGTVVVSSKPIALFSGHGGAYVPSEPEIVRYSDTLVQQIPPVAYWGRQFATAPLRGRESYDVFRVLASEDSTTVSVTCNSTNTTLSNTNTYQLDEGSFTEFRVPSDEYCFIQGSANILVLQFSVGFDADNLLGDPTMIIVPAISQYSNYYSLPTITTRYWEYHFFNILIPTSFYQLDQIFLNDEPLSSYNLSFIAVKQGDDPIVYAARMNVTAGVYTLYHTNPLATMGVIVYGFVRGEAYGHPGKLQLTPVTCTPPCVNGTCVDGNMCICSDGYEGDRCDQPATMMPTCTPNPCLNGGICSLLAAGTIVSCTCPTGYTGTTCQTEINPCSTNPCLNGGTCSQLASGAVTCTCPTGYTGNTCQTITCTPSCVNGTCVDGNMCVCSDGYEGDRCNETATMMPTCTPNPCLNGGICSLLAAGTIVSCTCPTGYTGTTCQTEITTACTPNPCLNGGTCSQLASGAVSCTCPTGYTGNICQTETRQTVGSEYYVSFFENGTPNRLYVYVTTLERQYVDFTIFAPGTSYSSSGRVRYGEVVAISLPYFTYRLIDPIERGKTLVVQSENTLLVYGVNQGTQGSSTDSFLALPKMEVDALNEYKYIAATYTTDPSLISSRINQEGEIAVVSQYNNTVVSITPSVDVSVNSTATAAGSTTNITLQYAEILLITDTDDMTGTVVVSSKPIALFSGHNGAYVPSEPEIVRATDTLVQQIPSVAYWGRQFATAPLRGRESYDVFRVLASEDSTTVSVTCNSTNTSISNTNAYQLDEGGFTEFRVPSDEYCFIQGSVNILVLQFSVGIDADNLLGDPTMIIVPAISQYSNYYSLPTVTERFWEYNFLNILIPTAFYQLDQIFLNDEPLSSYNLSFIAVKQDDDPIVYAAQMNVTAGVYTLYHTNPLATMGVIVYGFVRGEAYGHPGKLQLTPVTCTPPCVNGACVDGNMCICSDGYEGDRCDQTATMMPTCTPNPCLNDGICSLLAAGTIVSCTCPTGYTGNICQTSVPTGGTNSSMPISGVVLYASLGGVFGLLLVIVIAIVILVISIGCYIHYARKKDRNSKSAAVAIAMKRNPAYVDVQTTPNVYQIKTQV